MSSITSISAQQIPSFVITSDSGRTLSETTIQRLLALGIDPATVTTETEAQILIAQAEAAKNEENSHQNDGGKQQEKRKAELQQNIFNTMDMISVSNKLILGL